MKVLLERSRLKFTVSAARISALDVIRVHIHQSAVKDLINGKLISSSMVSAMECRPKRGFSVIRNLVRNVKPLSRRISDATI